ncbi:MAG: YciI family protein [Gemmatimonadaceae bacterium]
MSDFILLYRSAPASRAAAFATPEMAQQSMQRWLAWMRELEKQGHLKESGQPLEASGLTVMGKSKAVTDGPFAEAKDLIGGYSIITAKDIAEAAELAKGCPILEGDGSVEVRPVRKMDM